MRIERSLHPADILVVVGEVAVAWECLWQVGLAGKLVCIQVHILWAGMVQVEAAVCICRYFEVVGHRFGRVGERMAVLPVYYNKKGVHTKFRHMPSDRLHSCGHDSNLVR